MPLRKPQTKSPRRETPLQIRLTDEEKRMFAEAADRQHLTLSAWMRLAALRAIDAERGR